MKNASLICKMLQFFKWIILPVQSGASMDPTNQSPIVIYVYHVANLIQVFIPIIPTKENVLCFVQATRRCNQIKYNSKFVNN